MNALLLILRREYRLRLRRPSFWLLTLLIPLVLVALYALPVVAAQRAQKVCKVLVVDQTGLFAGSLRSTQAIHFHTMPTLEYAERQAEAEQADAILLIPARETTIPHDAFLYYHRHVPSPTVQAEVSHQLQQLLRNALLEDVYQLDASVYHSVESTRITLHTRDAATGHESFAQVRTVVAVVLAVLMVVALLLFGVQTFRAVREEKQNRTAEVMATSVRPVHLLAGKLAAVALVGLTQLVLWILLTAVAIQGVQAANPDLFAAAREAQQHRALATKGEEATALYNSTVQVVDEAVQGLTAIRLPLVAALFALYFVLGYLLYGGLLAALASRLEPDADPLQWSLLAISPLLLVLPLLTLLTAQPDAPLSVGLTLFPLTAPATTLARLPFGLPTGQVMVSVLLLAIAAAAAILLAARTYRRHLLR